jgi:hypothetical protein
MKKFAIAVLALAVLAVGMAMADRPVNQTFETQGITTSTAVVATGDLTNAETVVWTMSNQNVAGASLADGEVQYTMSYTQSLQDNNGYSQFNAGNALDTANQVGNTYNYKTTKQVGYVSSESALGQAAISESLVLDGAAMNTTTSGQFLCPFGAAAGDYPAFCNIIEVGSSFSGTAVQMTTGADERRVAKSSNYPVVVDYTVGLAGQGTASAYYRAHIQEARGQDTGNKSVDVVASEKTTASGTIDTFSKVINYQSGPRRV